MSGFNSSWDIPISLGNNTKYSTCTMPFCYCGNRNLRLQPPSSKALNFALKNVSPDFLFILELFLLKSPFFSVRDFLSLWEVHHLLASTSHSHSCAHLPCVNRMRAKPASVSGRHFMEKVFSGGSNADRNKGGRELPTHTHPLPTKPSGKQPRGRERQGLTMISSTSSLPGQWKEPKPFWTSWRANGNGKTFSRFYDDSHRKHQKIQK